MKRSSMAGSAPQPACKILNVTAPLGDVAAREIIGGDAVGVGVGVRVRLGVGVAVPAGVAARVGVTVRVGVMT
jgi:hypothetical protein